MKSPEPVQPNFGCTSSDRKYICTLPKGHEPAMHEAHGAPGIILHSWPVQPSGNTPEPTVSIPNSVPLSQRTKDELVVIIGRYSEELKWYVEERNRLIAEVERVAASSKEAPKWICPFCKKDKVRESELKRHIRKHVYRDRMAERIAAEATPSPAREETRQFDEWIDKRGWPQHALAYDNYFEMWRGGRDAGARSVVVAPQTQPVITFSSGAPPGVGAYPWDKTTTTTSVFSVEKEEGDMAKWSITLEWIRGSWVILVRKGRGPIRGSASASDLETAMGMASELFEGCLEWPEADPDAASILLKPPTAKKESKLAGVAALPSAPKPEITFSSGAPPGIASYPWDKTTTTKAGVTSVPSEEETKEKL